MRPTSINSVYVYTIDKHHSHVALCLIQGFLDKRMVVRSNTPIDNIIGSRGISAPFSLLPNALGFEVAIPTFTEDLFIIDLPPLVADYFEICRSFYQDKHVIFLNYQDIAPMVDYDERVLAFATHVNKHAARSGSILPIGFGLSNDIIERSKQHDLSRKRNSFVLNFNKTLNQDIRLNLELTLVENLEKMFRIDRRHLSPEDYAGQLAESAAVFAYGGTHITNMLECVYNRDNWDELTKRAHTYKTFDREVAVGRWDSWRFWEAAVFGCAPFQLDFEKYGFSLPVMPKPWVHYVPIDFSTVSYLPAKLWSELEADPLFLAKIGANARDWAIANYSPSVVADYVMKSVLEFNSKNP